MTAVERAEGKVDYAARLLKALGGSPEGWEWTGEVFEQDPGAPGATPCACGHHGLRYLFPWENKTRNAKITTGSTCVDTVPYLDPGSVEQMKAKLEELKAKHREDERKARQAAAEATVAKLREELEAKLKRYFGYEYLHQVKMDGGFLSASGYDSLMSCRYWLAKMRQAGNLKSAKMQLKRLEIIRETALPKGY